MWGPYCVRDTVLVLVVEEDKGGYYLPLAITETSGNGGALPP